MSSNDAKRKRSNRGGRSQKSSKNKTKQRANVTDAGSGQGLVVRLMLINSSSAEPKFNGGWYEKVEGYDMSDKTDDIIIDDVTAFIASLLEKKATNSEGKRLYPNDRNNCGSWLFRREQPQVKPSDESANGPAYKKAVRLRNNDELFDALNKIAYREGNDDEDDDKTSDSDDDSSTSVSASKKHCTVT
jgi:hypothetical protein